MKLSSIFSSVALASNIIAAIATKPDIEFDDVAAAFHLSSELVRESFLRGTHDSNLEAPRRNRNNRQRANEWLSMHNSKREEYVGPDYVPMMWSNELKLMAEDWANTLAANCKNEAPSTPYGWNTAGKQGSPDFRSVEDVMTIWENKLDKGRPENYEFTQVLWQATEYVGCADAVSPPASDKVCTFSVCYYAKPGNCGMKQYSKYDWQTPVMTGKACGPCPPDFPECNAEPDN
mmetsp:Transcript_26941/g.56708  ORF Transcript_26941/g.56708 Transcript_26941/m.56708 type:complete len:233 (-) Transcript_26941:189-887(-)|eukprot:CAMPEP_0171337634 /NCGR_PEP_ID=MMETSP0878-20121228/6808_1 /TAXON_ID=67004 /ORGANISM="Thalassiosira weissflogii, Strain CCMP1336" /LENGTH=232 /DNA_ID=CAMNT_0011839281 /DNA_START=116 /DNA_END=814 /DNA_ORIENTATION=+